MSEEFYYDYVSDSGQASHLHEGYPRSALRSLHRIEARVRDSSVKSAARYELHYADMFMLTVLERHKPDCAATVSELKDALFYTKGSMTKRIDRLEERHLIERVAHPQDRRATVIRLTSEGRKLTREIIERGRRNSIVTDISTVMDEQEWVLLADLLMRIDKRLEERGYSVRSK